MVRVNVVVVGTIILHRAWFVRILDIEILVLKNRLEVCLRGCALIFGAVYALTKNTRDAVWLLYVVFKYHPLNGVVVLAK